MSNWFGELDRFEAELRSLAVRLRGEADSMERELRLPSEDVIVALESAIKHFRAIAEQVTRSGDVHSTKATALQTVHELRDFIRADQARRQNLVDGFRLAKSALARVTQLRHRELASFGALDGCWEAARNLQGRIDWAVQQDCIEETLEQLRVDIAPFVALLRLVDQYGNAPHDFDLEDLVHDCFGRDLARAASRGSLILASGEPSGPQGVDTSESADPLSTDAEVASRRESNIPKAPQVPTGVTTESTNQADPAYVPARHRRKSMRVSPMVLGSSIDVDVEKMPSTPEHYDDGKKTTTRPPPPSLVHQPIPVDQILDRVLGSASRPPETIADAAATTVAKIEAPIEGNTAPANDTISENVLVESDPPRREGESSVHAESTSTEIAVAQMSAPVDVSLESMHADATIQELQKATLQDVVAKPFAGASQDDDAKTQPHPPKVEIENDDASLQTISTSLTSLTDALPEDPIELAKLIRNIGIDYADHAVRRLVWELIRQNRIGIAYHIVRCLETRDRMPSDVLPSSILRAMTVAPLIDSSYGEGVEELSACIHAINNEAHNNDTLPAAIRLARNLVLFGISLRPSLFAPSTGAAVLLEQLDLLGHLAGLNTLREAIVKFSRVNLQLTPSILKGVREYVAWESEIQNQREKCHAWREHVKHAQLNYAPATYVWSAWFESGGALTSLFDIVVEDRRDRVVFLQRAVESWSQPQYVAQMIDKTDRSRRPDAKTKPIEGKKGKGRLEDRTKEAVAHLKDWLDILARDPSRTANSEYLRANECRNEVLNELEGAIETVDKLKQTSRSRSLIVACGRASVALDDLFHLFEVETANSASHLIPREALSDELLTIPSISVNRDWDIPVAHYAKPDLLDALLAHIARGPVDWRMAFEEQTRLGNHEATELILERLTNHPVDGIDVAELLATRERDIAEQRAKLKDLIRNTKEAIERAISEDLYPESEVMDFRSVVESISYREARNFALAKSHLDHVRKSINERRQQRIEEVRDRLKSYTSSADLGMIQTALDSGNLLAANEYMAMLDRGEPIHPVPVTRDAFAEFFPSTLQAIHNAINTSPKGELIRAIGRQNSSAPFDMTGVPVDQAEEAKRMLNAWNEAFNYAGADAGGQLVRSLITVLEALGFRNVQLVTTDARGSDRLRSYNMQSEPLKEPQACVIPQYGSLAAGRYRLLCVWKRPSEEELLDLVASSQHHDRPIILLYFGRMSDMRRRSVSHLCRQRRRSFVLIDENLLFFLSMEKGQRLSALFSCTFPFTIIDPYTTTAGLVPLEMFFGRAQARQSVFDMTGTSLVYGGRQLGKTALLRDTERRYHAPAKGIIVKWIDLKAEGIGMNRPIRDLWTVIAATLHQEKVLAKTDYTPETLGTRIFDWLEKDPSLRIVLLLDEADAFLKSDAETPEGPHREVFSNVWRLKGIMDKTGRRFKVVFAGLHNVQRTSRDVNSPLAHLGTPICIGPLLENGEWQEARRLVTMPFSQLGYRFEQVNELPTRILAHANWYPSLIQLFCKHLLEHLTDPNRTSFNNQACPPYTITLQHIEEAYQRQELRKAIVDRFRWTLDLDPRYRVIALVIAHESAQRREGLVSGFAVQWIREQSLMWWESGFRGTLTLEGFRTILDEMIGLGLLRRVGAANYALRSPNVINLLGTQNEIEQALYDAMNHQPPPEYEAATFRRTSDQHGSRRSPLTALQESDLFAPSNDVVLLFGSKPAGLNDIGSFLRTAAKAHGIGVDDEWREVKNAAQFRNGLDARMERRDEGIMLFVVPNACPWTVDWIAEATSKIALLKSQKKFVKVVFVADPKKVEHWVNHIAADKDSEIGGGVKEMSLNPWHATAVRRWLIDIELGPAGGNGVEQFGDVTGNWGLFLHEVAARCEKGRHQWSRYLQEFEEELVKSKTWLEQFEITPAAMPVLRVLAEMEESLSVDDICELMPNTSRHDVEKSMLWAERMGFVSLVGIQQWRIDPVLGRLLNSIPA